MSETVDRIIAEAAKRGVTVDREEVRTFVYARSLMGENENARTVVKNFEQHLATGVRVESFAEFLLPERPQTEEERTENHEANRKTLAWHNRNGIINHEVTAKCRKAGVYRWETPGIDNGRWEGIHNFKLRTGLSDEAILAMSTAELSKFA